MRAVAVLLVCAAAGCAGAAPRTTPVAPQAAADAGPPRPSIPVDAGPPPPPPRITGHIPQEQVTRVAGAHGAAVEACYERERMRNPGLRGRVVVRLVVPPSGVVSRAEVVRTTLGSASVEGCILRQCRGWRFPPRDDDGFAAVQLTTDFEPP